MLLMGTDSHIMKCFIKIKVILFHKKAKGKAPGVSHGPWMLGVRLVAGVDVGLSTLSLAPISNVIFPIPPHAFTRIPITAYIFRI